MFCGWECKLVVCIYGVLKLTENHTVCNYVVPTSIKMMETEIDLFDLGVCGDELRVNMVI